MQDAMGSDSQREITTTSSRTPAAMHTLNTHVPVMRIRLMLSSHPGERQGRDGQPLDAPETHHRSRLVGTGLPSNWRSRNALMPLSGSRVSGSCGHVGGEDVVGVSVEVLAGAVVAHGGAWVGVAGCDLDVAEVDACVEHGGDVGVAEH